MLYSFITLATLCAVCIVAHGQQTGDENCETLPFQLHLIKGFCLRFSSRSLIYLNIFSQRNTTNSEDCSEHAMAKWQSINAKVFATVKCSLLSSHRQVSLRYSIYFFHWMLNNNSGFPKECYCCRESYLKDRLVTLNHCYDPDGIRLTSNDMSTMDLRLKEPAECKCFKCGDFSR